MLKQWDKANFDELVRAMGNGDCCLVDMVRKSDGEHVSVICAYWQEGKRYWFTPLAQMIEGNAYKGFERPDPDEMDGYFGPKEGKDKGENK